MVVAKKTRAQMVHLYFPMACGMIWVLFLVSCVLLDFVQGLSQTLLTFLIISNACLVNSVIFEYSLFSKAVLLISLLPIPTATTPAANQALRFFSSTSTPPVGMNKRFGNNSLIALRKEGPNKLPGNNLIILAPNCSALMISVGVMQPGTQSILCLSANFAASSTKPGLMM